MDEKDGKIGLSQDNILYDLFFSGFGRVNGSIWRMSRLKK